ncbi:replicative DNA helicase [Anoxybacillus sp. D401a]|uniref:replicative DNA helicase n=1 Tax=Anoxybacillus sp. D401a TaxID=575112 RepID=UPI003D32A878
MAVDKLELAGVTDGYRERIRRLALFDPLFDLERKRSTDLNGQPIDMKGLGLLALLFFFEQKLMRQYKTGVKQLASFLKKLTENVYVLDDEMYEDLARTIIQTFRPTTGKKRSYSFYDWEKREESAIEYSLLKANDFDVKTNTQYYTLDEDGLELVFATKEFYSEFQLSINQLMLRKQLEKGEFAAALKQINEMRIDVETLEERMTRLKHEIQRSIISEETFERYKQLLDDIYSRLSREDEEFKELREFVNETRERLYARDIHQKETKTYELVLKIARELESVHYAHSALLDKALSLKNTTLITAQESLYYTGLHSFNFDQDIVSYIVSTPLPLEAMKGVLHPFLKVEENRFWSPLAIFAEQNITEEREEKVGPRFLEADDAAGDDPYRTWLMAKYKELMQLFLEAHQLGRAHTLSEFFSYLDDIGQSRLYEQRYFYDFWIIMHQRSPVQHGDMQGEEGNTLLGDALVLLGGNVLDVQEGDRIIRKCERFSIQDMMITVREQ